MRNLYNSSKYYIAWVYIILVFSFWSCFAAWSCPWLSTDPYSCIQKDSKSVISEDIKSSSDPIIKWAQEAAKQTKIFQWGVWEWASRWTIDSAIMTRIQSVLNYAISFLATVALIYLIYNWFQLLIGNSDDTQKKALSKIKTVCWAIGWIWLSRFIISTMFWIIKQFTK